jgi:hypothetical protein
MMTAQFSHAIDMAVIAITAVCTGTALIVLRAIFGTTLARELDRDERCRKCR